MTETRNDWPADRIVAAGGGVAMVVGAFGPWLTANAVFVSATVTGMNGSDGKVIAGAGALCVGLVFARQYIPVVVIALFAAAAGIYDFYDINGRVSDLNADDGIIASVGWGIYVAIGGAAVAAFAAARLVKSSKAERTNAGAWLPPTMVQPDDGTAIPND